MRECRMWGSLIYECTSVGMENEWRLMTARLALAYIKSQMYTLYQVEADASCVIVWKSIDSHVEILP